MSVIPDLSSYLKPTPKCLFFYDEQRRVEDEGQERKERSKTLNVELSLFYILTPSPRHTWAEFVTTHFLQQLEEKFLLLSSFWYFYQCGWASALQHRRIQTTGFIRRSHVGSVWMVAVGAAGGPTPSGQLLTAAHEHRASCHRSNCCSLACSCSLHVDSSEIYFRPGTISNLRSCKKIYYFKLYIHF